MQYRVGSSSSYVVFNSSANHPLKSHTFCKQFTTPVTTLIDALVIKVANGEQIIIRECYNRCITELDIESFMVDLYTLEW